MTDLAKAEAALAKAVADLGKAGQTWGRQGRLGKGRADLEKPEKQKEA